MSKGQSSDENLFQEEQAGRSMAAAGTWRKQLPLSHRLARCPLKVLPIKRHDPTGRSVGVGCNRCGAGSEDSPWFARHVSFGYLPWEAASCCWPLPWVVPAFFSSGLCIPPLDMAFSFPS